jgi:hypothetical protein
MSNEFKGEMNSLKLDLRCLQYESKKLKTVSEEPSGASEEPTGLRRDIPCLKCELKKLKSIASVLPAVEEESTEFALPGERVRLKKSVEEAGNATGKATDAAEETENAAEGMKTMAGEGSDNCLFKK